MDSMLSGLRIMTNVALVDGPFEDWSKVRSHGRARRRRKKHPQRIRVYYTPSKTIYRMGDTIFCHPAMYAEIQRQVPA